MKPKVAGTGVGRLAFLADPNGARVELIQRDGKMRVEPIDHPIVKSFDHYSLTANDLDGASVLPDALGMKTLKVMGVPPASSRSSISTTITTCSSCCTARRPTPGPIFGHFALRVDAVDERSRHRGPGRPGRPDDAEARRHRIGNIGLIRDPDGVKIELVDRADLRDLP